MFSLNREVAYVKLKSYDIAGGDHEVKEVQPPDHTKPVSVLRKDDEDIKLNKYKVGGSKILVNYCIGARYQTLQIEGRRIKVYCMGTCIHRSYRFILQCL
jgi:hypothetical protein